MNKLVEFYVSVDIEAVGPIPGEYSMSGLGAFIAGGLMSDGSYITFDTEDLGKVFYSELKPLNDNYVTEAINVGVLKGFDYSKPDLDGSRKFEHMKTFGVEAGDAMLDFANFVEDFKKVSCGRPVFMAYPASFDWTFVYWYFQKFNVKSPFGFSSVLDLKTYYSAKFNVPLTKSVKGNMPKTLFPNLPHTHRADQDAMEQGVFGMNLLKS